jgi:broad specificity phosphatase PhoE
MNQVRLIIARHGETEFNKNGLLQGRGIDAPLNNTGIKQATAISEYLKGYDTNGLVSSSLKRSWQTAEPIQKHTDLEILKVRDLDEMDFGKYEGTPYQEVSGELKKLQKSWQSGDVNRPIPEGESPQEVYDRANGAVQEILSQTDNGLIVMILHGRLIRILLSEWLGYGLKNMHKVEHENGALYQLVYNGKFKSVYLNKTDHL